MRRPKPRRLIFDLYDAFMEASEDIAEFMEIMAPFRSKFPNYTKALTRPKKGAKLPTKLSKVSNGKTYS